LELGHASSPAMDVGTLVVLSYAPIMNFYFVLMMHFACISMLEIELGFKIL
jgi:hypothetical protein